MTLEQYQAIILAATLNDWKFVTCEGGPSGPSFRDALPALNDGSIVEIDSHHTTMSLKSDLLVSVSHGIMHNNDFKEGWANSFSHHHASSSFVDFFYANQLVHRDIYVSVDGGRCLIPLPSIRKHKPMAVARDRYEFFRILNRMDKDYDDYAQRAGVEIVDESWNWCI